MIVNLCTKTIIIAFVVAFFSCSNQDDKPKILEKVITRFVVNPAKYDTNTKKLVISNLSYKEEKNEYRCEFDMKITSPEVDTTFHLNRVYVSKDLKDVTFMENEP